MADVDPKLLTPGTVVRYLPTGQISALDRRKGPQEPFPGWWLTDSSGIADMVWEKGDWDVPIQAAVEEARHLRLIANDLRTAGDVPLVNIGMEGVSPASITLADELWLIALRLDPSSAFKDSQGPDGDPVHSST